MSGIAIGSRSHGSGARRCRVSVALALALGCALPTPDLRADDAVVLLVSSAPAGPAREQEQRLHTELSLTLDGFDVRAVESGDTGFGKLALSDKLGLIQLWVERNGAVATIWVEQAPSGQVLLHLVALATGRALVRIVEAESGPGAEAELALAARELLGEAYLFGPPPAAGAVARVVTAVQRRVAPPATNPEPVSPPKVTPSSPQEPRWALLPALRVGGGLYGQTGPHLKLGGGLAAERRVGRGGFVRIGLAAAGGPRGSTRDGLVSGWSVEPGIGIGYAWRVGRLALGPLVELAAPWTRLELALGTGDPQRFGWWGFRAGLGLDLRLSLTDTLALIAGWSAGAQARQEEFRRLSNGSTVLETPVVDWSASFGLVLYLGVG